VRVLTFGLSPVINLGIRHPRKKDKIQPGCVHGGHGCMCVRHPRKFGPGLVSFGPGLGWASPKVGRTKTEQNQF